MNKFGKLLLVFLLLCVKQEFCASKKIDKLEALFSIRYNKKQLLSAVVPVFAHFSEQFVFADDKAKKEAETAAGEAYYNLIKKAFVGEFGKRFEERELDELLIFYNSAVGKKLSVESFEVDMAIGTECQKLFAELSEIIVKHGGKSKLQEISGALKSTSTAVTHLEEVAKKNTKASVADLFEKNIAEGICAVKFSASWCPPCRTYKSIFEAVAEQYKELNKCTIKYIAVDINQASTVAQAYKVLSIPVTIFFKNGKEITRQIGALSKEALVAKLEEVTAAH